MDTHTRYYKVAGMTFQVDSEYPISDHTFHPKLKLFQSEGPGKDNILIRHCFSASPPQFKGQDPIYAKDRWKIYRCDDTWYYQYKPISEKDTGFPVTGEFNQDHSAAKIYAGTYSRKEYQKGSFGALTLFNTDQVILAKLLAQRNGIILHANGFKINGRGILLAGPSGIGKSTLSGMLKKESHTLLCDDRMLSRFRENHFQLYGHWNHGTHPELSNQSAPLKCIFFLSQGPVDLIRKIFDKKIILHQLFQSVVKHFFTSQEWDRALNVIEKMIQEVDCYAVEFSLDGQITKKIQDLTETYPITD